MEAILLSAVEVVPLCEAVEAWLVELSGAPVVLVAVDCVAPLDVDPSLAELPVCSGVSVEVEIWLVGEAD